MGKIIPAETITRGAYPYNGDHERVASNFMEAAETIPSVHAAIVFGSTALGHANRRSDVDIAIAHREGDAMAFFADLQHTFASLPQGNLIETHIVSAAALRKGQVHDGDVFLAEHLRLAALSSRIPGINPEAFAAMPDFLATLPPDDALTVGERVTKKYLHHKERKFFNALRSGDDQNHSRLQRAFELPMAITRKFARLQVLRNRGQQSAFNAEFYAKDSLAAQAQQLGHNNKDWQHSSAWLIERDREYTSILEETIEGNMTIKQYEAWIDQVSHSSLQHALRLSIAALAIHESAAIPDREGRDQ